MWLICSSFLFHVFTHILYTHIVIPIIIIFNVIVNRFRSIDSFLLDFYCEPTTFCSVLCGAGFYSRRGKKVGDDDCASIVLFLVGT